MKQLLTIIILCCTIFDSSAQPYLNHQLRLEPLWARVADALGEPASVESVEFSPDGKYLVSGTKFDNSVIIWRTSDGAELTKKDDGSKEGYIRVFDMASGEEIKTIHFGNTINELFFTMDDQYLLAVGHGNRLSDILGFSYDNIPLAHKVWAGDNAEYIDFNAHGSFLASAHQNGLIKLWVWMSEDPDLNSKRHSWVKEQ